MTALTKLDYQTLHSLVQAHCPPGRRVSHEEVVLAAELCSKLATVIADLRPAIEKGARVLEWRIPRDLALTGNAYAGSRAWKKHKDRKRLDDLLRDLLPGFSKAVLHGAHRRRWIRGTRFSTQQVDECALDLIGGKLAIDALKRADVIHDDNATFLVREALQAKAKRGETHLLIEVFEVTTEGADVAGPANARVNQVVHEMGTMTKAILEGVRR